MTHLLGSLGYHLSKLITYISWDKIDERPNLHKSKAKINGAN